MSELNRREFGKVVTANAGLIATNPQTSRPSNSAEPTRPPVQVWRLDS